MPSKSDYNNTFNELFGTDIDWTKLSKEELAQLMVIFANPEVLADKLGLEITVSPSAKNYRRKFVEGLMATFKEAIESYDGPIISKMRESLKDNAK